MIPISYDFHIHSCLSPCADNDMTPANIIGMAALCGLDAIALTDHNSTKNCMAAQVAGEKYGVLVIPGMELCTEEEVHVLCLFHTLKDAMAFDAFVYERLVKIENNKTIFGNQILYNEKDEVVGEEPLLLISATKITLDEVYSLLREYHGIMIPAHIDRTSNSLLWNLGFVPIDSKFSCIEIKDMKRLHTLRNRHSYLRNCQVITDSDAHRLQDINDNVNHIYVGEKSVESILDVLSKECK